MFALITTLLAGFVVFLKFGLLVATASIFCAYAVFAAYAYFRSWNWMKDPAVAAAIAEAAAGPRNHDRGRHRRKGSSRGFCLHPVCAPGTTQPHAAP
jgi:hypothetical protein